METWRIYYDDGSSYGSDDGRFEDAPLDGVIVIVRRSGDQTEFVSGADYYWRFEEDGTIVGTSDLSPLLRKLGFVKFGRYTSHVNHSRIMERAKQEWRYGS